MPEMMSSIVEKHTDLLGRHTNFLILNSMIVASYYTDDVPDVL